MSAADVRRGRVALLLWSGGPCSSASQHAQRSPKCLHCISSLHCTAGVRAAPICLYAFAQEGIIVARPSQGEIYTVRASHGGNAILVHGGAVIILARASLLYTCSLKENVRKPFYIPRRAVRSTHGDKSCHVVSDHAACRHHHAGRGSLWSPSVRSLRPLLRLGAQETSIKAIYVSLRVLLSDSENVSEEVVTRSAQGPAPACVRAGTHVSRFCHFVAAAPDAKAGLGLRCACRRLCSRQSYPLLLCAEADATHLAPWDMPAFKRELAFVGERVLCS